MNKKKIDKKDRETYPLSEKCPACGKEFKEGQKVIAAGLLTELFGYVFCDEECFQWYLDSK